MAPTDRLLIGTDLVKDRAVLEAAYNDSEGVTADFNRNVLRVLNRELDADFDLGAFEHVAFFDEANSWIEMRLRAKGAQTVTIDGADLVVEFADGEELRTEVSAKFTRAAVDRELGDAGPAPGRLPHRRPAACSGWRRLRSRRASDLGRGGRQPVVHEAHHHRALAHRRRHALGRAGPYVAGRVDARRARLEQSVPAGVGARQDEPVIVAGQSATEPIGAGFGTEEQEQERESHARAVAQRHGLELAVRPVQLRDLAAIPDLRPRTGRGRAMR